MRFKVSYLLKNGDAKTAMVEAGDERGARAAVAAEGFVTSVEREAAGRDAPRAGFFERFRAPGDFALMLFARELSTLLKAGLTMPEALDVIGGHMDNKIMRSAVEGLKDDIVAGSSFSAALKRRPAVFSDLFARCAEGGESASNLPEVLTILAQNLKNSHLMRSRMINVAVYPAMILSITFCVFTFLLLYVVPSFEAVFYEVRIEIPPHTAALFAASAFVKAHWALMAACAAAAAAAMFLTSAGDAASRACAAALRRLPVSSALLNNYSLFVFSGMLSAMLRSASPALEAFSTALFALRGMVSDVKREAAMEALRSGGSFSAAVESLGLPDSAMARMCAVGERSGKIADMIEMINGYYLENLQNSIERLAEVLEPLIIFLTGIFIAALILSVFLPVVKITMGGI